MTTIIQSLAEISDRYDAVFCDVWGCLHDGRAPFPAAVAALQGFRRKGGTVVLLTNAPRSRHEVEKQLDKLGVPRDSWDVITTSGDAARYAMFTGVAGDKVHFIGYEKDLSIFEPLKVVENPVPVRRVPLEEATGIVVAGPEDPYAPPEVYRPQFLYAKQKDLPLLCFNPDIVVDYGERRQYCAGALAQLYAQMGGRVFYFGKPHPPIYDLARRRLAAMGRDVPDARILAVGDGILTDVAGAMGEDLDCLFVSGGLAREETGTGPMPDGQPEPDKLKAYLAEHGYDPLWSIGYLR